MGNKILQDKDVRVFLDFGKSFSRRAAYFEEYLNPKLDESKWDLDKIMIE